MAEKKKNEWAEKLAYAPKNGYERLSAEEERAMHAYCEDYKDFLDHGQDRAAVRGALHRAGQRARLRALREGHGAQDGRQGLL